MVYDISINASTLDEGAGELGIYFIAMFICQLLMLDLLRGKSEKLHSWLLQRKLEVFKNEAHNNAKVVKVLYAACIMYIALPAIIVTSWAALVVYDHYKQKTNTKVGFCVFLVGWSMMLFGIGVLKIKWNSFRTKKVSLFAQIAALVLITIYQIVVIFGYEYEGKFFPYSALFLNFNVITMSALIYLRKFDKDSDISSVFERAFKSSGVPVDPERANDIEDELAKQSKDPSWKVSKEDLIDIITIGQVSPAKMADAFGAGLQSKFYSMSTTTQRIIEAVLLIVSLVILAVYALFIYQDNKNKMGVITAVSIILMDLFNLLLYNSKLIETPGSIIFLLIINRVLMVSLGAQHWIFGYIILYLLYAIAFLFLIAKHQFPFEGDVIIKGRKITNLLAKGEASEAAAAAAQALKRGARSPELLLGILTVYFAVLVGVVSSIKIAGVDLKPIQIPQKDGSAAKELSYPLVAGLSIVLAISTYFCAGLYRLLVRKATRMEIYDTRKPATASCCTGRDCLGQLNLYLLLTFVCCAFWSVFGWWITRRIQYLYLGILGSASFLAYLYAYLYFVLNEFDYFQDVEKVNKRIEQHNANIDVLETKRDEIQTKLLNGEIELPEVPDPNQPDRPPADSAEQKKLIQELISRTEKNENKDGTKGPAYIDLDAAERDGDFSKIAVSKLNSVTDWQSRKISWFEAYRAGSLRPNDEKFINAAIVTVVTYLLMAGAAVADFKSILGFIICVPVFYVGLCFLIGSTVIYQSRRFTVAETVAWILVNLVYVLLGLGYAGYAFDLKAMKLFSSQKSDKKTEASTFFFAYVLLAPTFTHGLMFGLRAADRGVKEAYDGKFKGMLICFIVGLVLIVVGSFLFLTWKEGVLYLFFIALVIYSAVQTWLYVKDGYRVGQKWKIANSILTFVLIAASVLYFVFVDSVNTYEGLSQSAMLLLFVLWMFAITQFFIDFQQSQERPVFYSSSLFPIYKYNPQISNIESHYGPATAWISGLFLLLVWAFCSTFALTPVWFGVVLSIGIQLLIMMSAIYMMSITRSQIMLTQDFMDEQTIKRAWLETKKSYFKEKGVFCRQDLLSYRTFWVRRFYLQNYIACILDREHKQPIRADDELHAEIKAHSADLRGFYASRVYTFLPKEIDINDSADLGSYSFQLDHLVQEARMSEVEQIIQLIMISVQNVFQWQAQEAKDFFQLLGTMKDLMFALGLTIQTPSGGSIAQRYRQVQDQIDELDPKEKQVFEQLQLYIKQQKEAKEEASKRAKELEQRLAEERRSQAEKLRREKEQRLLELQGESAQASVGVALTDQIAQLQKQREEMEEKRRKEEEANKQEEEQRQQQAIEQQRQEALIQQQLAELARAAAEEAEQEQEQERQRELEEQQRQLELQRQQQQAIIQQQMEAERQRQLQYQQQQAEWHRQREQVAQQMEAWRQQEAQRVKEMDEPQVDPNRNVDQMPDCLLKYQTIVAQAKQRRSKFVDAEFPHDNSSLGDEVANDVFRKGANWVSFSDQGGLEVRFGRNGDRVRTTEYYSIFKDGIDVNDIQQGQLGDCYYLSALAVLGAAQTRARFIFVDGEDEWRECGAFCIRFYADGKEDLVVIDDYFPLRAGAYPFVTSSDPLELWPMVLEKAYAKRYGSFAAISGGLPDQALAELTNGIPETLAVADENPERLWGRLYELQGEEVMLGAGSPSHEDGDRAKSSTGIVQGHAYSIMKLVQADQYKLICVRNPWGEGEWTGDWSDKSSLWTKRIKNLCGVQGFEDDGLFWMDWNDFRAEFEDIYICRNYYASKNWHNTLIEGEWRGESAEGLPTARNGRPEMSKNPQYGLTVTRPGRGYMVLRLKERGADRNARQAGCLQVVAQDGQLIQRWSRTDALKTVGPSSSPALGTEVEFPAGLRYPYTFSLLVANMEHGAEGEGHFAVQVFTQDPNAATHRLN